MAERLPEYMRDLVKNVGTDVVRDIVNDNRSPPRPAAPPSNVSIMGAGRVQDFDVGPAYRPYVPPKEDDKATTDRSGWREAPKVDDWRPPGVEIMDRMMDQQDAIDRAERIRQLAEASAIRKAEAELARQPEPKERKDKGQK
jgi:hypothetical protein